MTSSERVRQARIDERRGASGPRPADAASGSDAKRLCLIGVKVDAALRREIDAYAEAHGVSRSRAAGQLLAIAREAIHESEGVPGSRADELLEAVDGLRVALDILGPPTLGILRLMAHWAAQSGGVKVSEDELLAEVRSVGADEWEQAVAEAERDLPEAVMGSAQRELGCSSSRQGLPSGHLGPWREQAILASDPNRTQLGPKSLAIGL